MKGHPKLQVTCSDLSLCIDCMMLVETGALLGESTERLTEVVTAVEALQGEHGRLVADFDSDTGEGINEFSRRTCSCCGSQLGGSRHRYVTIG